METVTTAGLLRVKKKCEGVGSEPLEFLFLKVARKLLPRTANNMGDTV